MKNFLLFSFICLCIYIEKKYNIFYKNKLIIDDDEINVLRIIY